MVGFVKIDRGVMGVLPYAAVGSGPPLVVLAGLSPVAGAGSDGFVRGVLAPVAQLADRRRLIVLNRRTGLSPSVTMEEIAAEHAEAIRSHYAEPVDLVGVSTGGSIAQQLAADSPDVVKQLVLVSSACRLGPFGRKLQSDVAAELRAGRTRSAIGGAAAGFAPLGLRTIARGIGLVAAPRVIKNFAVAADLAATIAAEDGFDLAKCSGQIQAETLIIAGERDRLYGSAVFRETAALIPNSQLRLLPKRGHIGATRDRHALAQLAGFVSG